jgi:hypothetical protein
MKKHLGLIQGRSQWGEEKNIGCSGPSYFNFLLNIVNIMLWLMSGTCRMHETFYMKIMNGLE